MAPALFAFAAKLPRISVERILTNARVPLIQEGDDLAFRIGPLQDAEWMARRSGSVPLELAASPRFVREMLQGRTRLARDTLASAPAVLGRAGGTWNPSRPRRVAPHERHTGVLYGAHRACSFHSTTISRATSTRALRARETWARLG
jgi:LysR family transcriptional regulator, transcriptional activator AphB